MSQAAGRILLVTGRPGVAAGPGGVADEPGDLAGRLRRLGHDTRTLLAGRDLPGNPPRADLVECPGLASAWRMPWAVRRLGGGLAGGWRPDLIHALEADRAEAAVALAERWRLPYVLTVDEFLPPEGRLRLSRRWCRGLVAPGGELAADLVDGLGVPADLVSVIRPGIVPGTPRIGPAEPPEVAVVGAAGPLAASSGFATFLSAARRVLDAGIDAEFVLAGQGEDEVDLRRRVDRLRIADRVTFAGRAAVGGSYWSVLDLFCLTSTVPTTGRSLALAMAHGVPAIVADVPGLGDLVEHDRTGHRIPPDDSQALARAILILLADRRRARALGGAGRDRVVSAFDPAAEAEALSALYASALSDPGPAPLTAAAIEPAVT